MQERHFATMKMGTPLYVQSADMSSMRHAWVVGSVEGGTLKNDDGVPGERVVLFVEMTCNPRLSAEQLPELELIQHPHLSVLENTVKLCPFSLHLNFAPLSHAVVFV